MLWLVSTQQILDHSDVFFGERWVFGGTTFLRNQFVDDYGGDEAIVLHDHLDG
jgi:hypothetical protein